jgi:peptidoglycan/xylan/chitin deacetylase (PgdA/CDA1 family)
VRSAIVDELFARFVTRDEASLAEEWYLSRDHLAAMVKVGMHVGSHGHAHVWLDRLSRAEQARDIEQSLALLEELGVPRAERTFCYPYGGYNRDTLALLAEHGFAAALTTRVGVADLARDRPLELPRLDTNDLLPGRRVQHA